MILLFYFFIKEGFLNSLFRQWQSLEHGFHQVLQGVPHFRLGWNSQGLELMWFPVWQKVLTGKPMKEAWKETLADV